MSNSPYTSAFNLVGGEQIAGMAVVDKVMLNLLRWLVDCQNL